jgi:hypothetical protein
MPLILELKTQISPSFMLNSFTALVNPEVIAAFPEEPIIIQTNTSLVLFAQLIITSTGLVGKKSNRNSVVKLSENSCIANYIVKKQKTYTTRKNSNTKNIIKMR